MTGGPLDTPGAIVIGRRPASPRTHAHAWTDPPARTTCTLASWLGGPRWVDRGWAPGASVIGRVRRRPRELFARFPALDDRAELAWSLPRPVWGWSGHDRRMSWVAGVAPTHVWGPLQACVSHLARGVIRLRRIHNV